jgi:hypothetical protein
MTDKTAIEEYIEVNEQLASINEQKVKTLVQLMENLVVIIDSMEEDGMLEVFNDEYADYVRQLMDECQKIIALESRTGAVQ